MSRRPDRGPGDGRLGGDARSGSVRLVDQTLLPGEFVQVECRDVPAVWEAIRSLRVRGAPRSGSPRPSAPCSAASRPSARAPRRSARAVRAASDHLRTSRPTAVNLFWALDRIDRVADSASATDPVALLDRLLAEARAIADEDRAMCRAIGRFGAGLIGAGQGVLTHCNAGGLATADYGTALAVIFTAFEDGTPFRVFADETRPLLQGSRLTAWELQRRGVPVTLICDNMAAQVMKERKIHLVVVGADRIAANGDTANKIGTYGVALLARAHGIPFYVAAPSSTFDLTLADGSSIPIEQRDPREITHGQGRATAPEGIDVYNPAFDVTPAGLIAGIITERGIIRPVNAATIREASATLHRNGRLYIEARTLTLLSDPNEAMIAHNVFFKLHDGSEAARAKLVQACKTYLTGHPGLVFFAAGTIEPDLGRPVNDRDFDVSLHLVFETESTTPTRSPRGTTTSSTRTRPSWAKVRVFDSVVEAGYDLPPGRRPSPAGEGERKGNRERSDAPRRPIRRPRRGPAGSR